MPELVIQRLTFHTDSNVQEGIPVGVYDKSAPRANTCCDHGGISRDHVD